MKDGFCEVVVGHMKFVVSKTTLLKEEGSTIAKLLSEKTTKGRAVDVIYIDRDGTHFNAILNYLRGCLNLNDWTARDLRELAIEADYYSLADLKKQIVSALEKVGPVQRMSTSWIGIDCHLTNPKYNKLMDSLVANNRKTLVVFVRSDRNKEIGPFLAKLEEEFKDSKDLEITFIYDIYPHQKIQMFEPRKGFLVNVCALKSLNSAEAENVAYSMDDDSD